MTHQNKIFLTIILLQTITCIHASMSSNGSTASIEALLSSTSDIFDREKPVSPQDNNDKHRLLHRVQAVPGARVSQLKIARSPADGNMPIVLSQTDSMDNSILEPNTFSAIPTVVSTDAIETLHHPTTPHQIFTQNDIDKIRKEEQNTARKTIYFYQVVTVLTTTAAIFNSQLFTQAVYAPSLQVVKQLLAKTGSLKK